MGRRGPHRGLQSGLRPSREASADEGDAAVDGIVAYMAQERGGDVIAPTARDSTSRAADLPRPRRRAFG